MQRALSKLLAPINRRIRQIATRAIVSAINTDTALVALTARVSESELLARLEYFEPYGFTASPPVGSEAIVLSLGGRREHTVVLQVANRQFRLKGLSTGDVALYNKNGDKIVLNNDGNAEVTVSKKIKMKCPNIELTGNVLITGNLTLNGDMATSGNQSISGTQITGVDVVGGGISLKGHVHGGIKSGGGSTSSPQ